MELASRSSASNGAADLERIFLAVDVVLAAAKAVLWLFLAILVNVVRKEEFGEGLYFIWDVEALAAASKTVDCLKLVHSLHVSFIVAGDNNAPIIYQVHHVRDGKSFATRQVDAK